MVDVPVRCQCVIALAVDIDITQKPTLRAKLIQIINDLKTEFPDKIAESRWDIDTAFAHEGGTV